MDGDERKCPEEPEKNAFEDLIPKSVGPCSAERPGHGEIRPRKSEADCDQRCGDS